MVDFLYMPERLLTDASACSIRQIALYRDRQSLQWFEDEDEEGKEVEAVWQLARLDNVTQAVNKGCNLYHYILT